MIALVIIALGLLGVAGIMALAMNNNGTARTQSLAAIEASNLYTAMLANPAYWLNGPGATTTQTAPTSSSTSCNGTVCSPAQIANQDLSNWGYSIAQTLPNGTGSVACAQSAGPAQNSPQTTLCTIDIQWQENDMSLDHTTGSVVSGAMESYQLVVQP